ncbi:MAG: DUF2163 domain-containing protein [Sulfuritalea sp.]|nr:DUF2163 domain-containing protein [Sulfuritalea sp.]
MKTLPTNLATHVATRATTLATALKITRTDAQVFGFTTHDIDDLISGVTYSSNPGLDVSNIVIAASAAVGNLEMTTLHDGTVFTTAEILGGVWRNAAFIIFRYNWASLADGIDTLLTGTLGEVELKLNTVVAELRDLRQYLQQPVGNASSKTCRARLGDAKCTKVLTAFTYTGTLTGATNNQVFQDTGRGEAANWFDEGQITFDSGANSGRSAKIKTFASGGSFTLALPMYALVAAGDTYTAIAGCRKRLAEDCVGKFSNVLFFVGEPHRKGINDLTKSPEPSV